MFKIEKIKNLIILASSITINIKYFIKKYLKLLKQIKKLKKLEKLDLKIFTKKIIKIENKKI